MVGSWGWIIPDPLAIPVTAPFPDRKGALASLGRESVVRMASANWRSRSIDAPAPAISLFSWEVIFATGSGTPIMPVDEGKTSRGLAPSSRAAAAHVALHARRPTCPLAHLAFPALTITPHTRTTP